MGPFASDEEPTRGRRVAGGARPAMTQKPEQQARVRIDAALAAAGWVVQNRDEINLAAGNVSLDLFSPCYESLEDSANLPDPHVLAEEIADDLRSALEQIESVLGDLEKLKAPIEIGAHQNEPARPAERLNGNT